MTIKQTHTAYYHSDNMYVDLMLVESLNFQCVCVCVCVCECVCECILLSSPEHVWLVCKLLSA